MFLEIEPRVKVYLPPGTCGDHFMPPSSQSDSVAGSQEARAKIVSAHSTWNHLYLIHVAFDSG